MFQCVLEFGKRDLLFFWWLCSKLPNLYLGCEFRLSGSPLSLLSSFPFPSLPLCMPMCSFNTQRSAGELEKGERIWLSAHPVTYATLVPVYFWSRLGESSKDPSSVASTASQSGDIRHPTPYSRDPLLQVTVNLCSLRTTRV